MFSHPPTFGEILRMVKRAFAASTIGLVALVIITAIFAGEFQSLFITGLQPEPDLPRQIDLAQVERANASINAIMALVSMTAILLFMGLLVVRRFTLSFGFPESSITSDRTHTKRQTVRGGISVWFAGFLTNRSLNQQRI